MNTFRFCLLLALLLPALAPAESRAQGLFGAGDLSVGGSFLYGERLDGSGGGFSAHLEYASMFEETALGGYMGMEILVALGYESFSGEDPHGGDFTQGPLLFDMQLGFPVTLFRIGGGAPGTTLFTVGLGAGASVQHVYGYLRARILTQLGENSFLELMGRWTPSEASNDWTERTGLDIYEARVSFITPVSEDITLQFFAEWSTGDRARLGREDPTRPAIEPPEVTTSYQSVWRAGVGFVF